MSSRKEQKERLRQERLEREAAAKASADRRRRLLMGGGVLAAAIAVVVVVVLVVSGGGGGSDSSTTASNSGSTSSSSNLDQSGVRTTKAPWAPEYSFLAQRLSALEFPQQSDIGYHVHAALFVYVDGKQVPVPANIGIDPQGRFIAALHTHDTSGVVHMEATKPYPFTLGEFINIWGVAFSDNTLGAYKAGNGNVLQLWVNGKQVSDPVNYKMKSHDVMILGYGKPGSFPTKKSYNFGEL